MYIVKKIWCSAQEQYINEVTWRDWYEKPSTVPTKKKFNAATGNYY